LNLTLNCDSLKAQNRNAILLAEWMVFVGVKSWCDFRLSWHDLWIRLIVPWVVRNNCATILPVSSYYLSVLVHFWSRASREKNLGNQRR